MCWGHEIERESREAGFFSSLFFCGISQTKQFSEERFVGEAVKQLLRLSKKNSTKRLPKI
jgi:hypothetical protein